MYGEASKLLALDSQKTVGRLRTKRAK